MKEVVVIGIGNILQKDDGVGVHVIKQLEKESLPSSVELVDGGTSTLSMLSYFTDFKKVIIIDSLKGGLEPGTVYKIRPEDITNYKKENLSIHDAQILDVVKMVNMMGNYPDVVIYGIEPKEIKFDLEMTDIIKGRIPEVIEHVKNELGVS